MHLTSLPNICRHAEKIECRLAAAQERLPRQHPFIALIHIPFFFQEGSIILALIDSSPHERFRRARIEDRRWISPQRCRRMPVLGRRNAAGRAREEGPDSGVLRYLWC
jgi:hypothetical protein